MGAALEKMLYDDSTAGKTFELYGPKQYSLAEIAALVDKEIYKKRRHINVPKAILKPAAKVLNDVLWWHTISADEVEREFIDQVIDPEASTFKDLGIEPGDIANFTYHYLVSDAYSEACYVAGQTSNFLYSKDSEALITTTSPLPPRRKRRRTRSTSMFWMSYKHIAFVHLRGIVRYIILLEPRKTDALDVPMWHSLFAKDSIYIIQNTKNKTVYHTNYYDPG